MKSNSSKTNVEYNTECEGMDLTRNRTCQVDSRREEDLCLIFIFCPNITCDDSILPSLPPLWAVATPSGYNPKGILGKNLHSHLRKEHGRFRTEYGGRGALLIQSPSTIVQSFPRKEKVKYASFAFESSPNDMFEYEDDDDDASYKYEEDDQRAKKRDEIIIGELNKAKWIYDTMRFSRMVEYEKARLKKMNLDEINNVIKGTTSLIGEAKYELDIKNKAQQQEEEEEEEEEEIQEGA
ncbi:unnamed protein product [Cochlearia groenlandica]